MAATPLHRLPKAHRRELVDPLVGQPVTVYVDLHRDGSRFVTYTGDLVDLAATIGGNLTDALVLRLLPGYAVSERRTVVVSIATVAGIAEVGGRGRTVGRIPEELAR
jgi:hypothetical protein